MDEGVGATRGNNSDHATSELMSRYTWSSMETFRRSDASGFCGGEEIGHAWERERRR